MSVAASRPWQLRWLPLVGPPGSDAARSISVAAVGDAVIIPYAFNGNGAGTESGGLRPPGDFFGTEITHFDQAQQGDRFHFYQQVTTVDLAYQYVTPNWALEPQLPVALYVGAGAGGAFVNAGNRSPAFGIYKNRNTNGSFSSEVQTGFQFRAGEALAFRLGYRYVTITDVWRSNQYTNLNTSALEGGLAYRF